MTELQQQADELHNELASLRVLTDEIGSYIYSKDIQGRYTYANRYVLDLFGKTLQDTLGRDDSDFFDLERSTQLRDNDLRVLQQGATIAQEEVAVIKASGEQRIYWVVKKPMRDDDGNIIGMCGISTDITERKAMEAKLAEQHLLLQTILDNVDAHIYIKDPARRFRYINKKTAQMFGCEATNVAGKRDIDVIPQQFAEQLWQMDQKVFASNSACAEHESFPDHDGAMRHYWSVKVPLQLAEDDPVLIGFSTDITELYQLKEQLHQKSITDALTGLYNRRIFFELAEKELMRARRYHCTTSLLMIDADNFKGINDRYGHPIGDKVLLHLSKLLQQRLRAEDLLARVGGEEFAILLANAAIEEALRVAEDIRAEIAGKPLQVNGHQIFVTVSMGVVQDCNGTGPLSVLYELADEKLYLAKNSGRNRVCY